MQNQLINGLFYFFSSLHFFKANSKSLVSSLSLPQVVEERLSVRVDVVNGIRQFFDQLLTSQCLDHSLELSVQHAVIRKHDKAALADE